MRNHIQNNLITFTDILIILFQFSTNDPLTPPWKIDPCQLDEMSHGSTNTSQEPVHLFSGKLRIMWNHNGNTPNYKLIVTALGKGYTCNQSGKHACLRLG